MVAQLRRRFGVHCATLSQTKLLSPTVARVTEGLVEERDRWVLPLGGRTVARCFVDYSFGLVLDGKGRVEVSLSYFRFRDSDGVEHSLNTEADRRLLAPALACFGLSVAQACALKSGQLRITYTDGTLIEADPHDQFESWQVSGPGNLLVVSAPGGGEPAVWDGSRGSVVSLDELRFPPSRDDQLG